MDHDHTGTECHCCGEALPEGNLAWDLPAPDPVAYLSEAECDERIVAATDQVMVVRGLGNFIRVILPVPVEGDREATFGVWLAITEPREWRRVMDAGAKGGDAWAGLTFAGRLTSALQPWPEVFGAWAQAVVPGAGKVPRISHSVDPLLARVLTERWPEDLIRDSRGTHVPGDMTGGPVPNPYAKPGLLRRLFR